MKTRFVQILAVVLFLTHPAVARDSAIGKFYGSFEGAAIWGSGIMPREMSVVISPIEGGINIFWDTTSLKDLNSIKSKSHSIDLLKISNSNLFLEKSQKNRTDIPTVRDPKGSLLPRTSLIWARVDENTLSLYIYVRKKTNLDDLQVYRRTVDGENMRLHFIRYRDGRIVKQTKGKLRRVAD